MSIPFKIYLLAAVSACATVLAALPLWRKWCLRTGLVDDPGQRKIHDQPIHLAGGLAVMTGLLVPTLLACLVLWLQGAGSNAGSASVTSSSASHDVGRLGLLDPNSAFLLEYGLGRRAMELAGELRAGTQLVFVVQYADQQDTEGADENAAQLHRAPALPIFNQKRRVWIQQT